jgi:hypothetical protein
VVSVAQELLAKDSLEERVQPISVVGVLVVAVVAVVPEQMAPLELLPRPVLLMLVKAAMD